MLKNVEKCKEMLKDVKKITYFMANPSKTRTKIKKC